MSYPAQPGDEREALVAAIEDERQSRYKTIDQLRERFGGSWAHDSAQLRIRSDEAVDALLAREQQKDAEIERLREALTVAPVVFREVERLIDEREFEVAVLTLRAFEDAITVALAGPEPADEGKA